MNIILKIKWEKVFSMFLEKYLNSTYLDLVYSNYEDDYIKLLDEDNFNKVSMSQSIRSINMDNSSKDSLRFSSERAGSFKRVSKRRIEVRGERS